jgi:hypothetical protein
MRVQELWINFSKIFVNINVAEVPQINNTNNGLIINNNEIINNNAIINNNNAIAVNGNDDGFGPGKKYVLGGLLLLVVVVGWVYSGK